ncbi:MAG TPA: hypothetical protein ENI85_07005, partial [Deltaproteobacteria bacterium]|nr:hypothetical protein [Deltaproteobacteria bacterium]
MPNSAWLSPESIQLRNNLICGNHKGELRKPERLLDPADAGNLTPTGLEGTGVAASVSCDDPAVVFEMLGTGDALDFTLSATSPALDSGATPQSLGLASEIVPIMEADQTGPAKRPQDGNDDGVAEFDRGGLERVGGATGTPPTVALTSPSTGTTVTASPVAVSGTVDNATSVVVNGVQATIAGGTFSADIPLIEGPNAIIAVATNADGSTESEILVTLDSPPLVTILAPVDGLQTSAIEIEVSGTATDLVGVQSVTVNGQPATQVGDTFSITLPLVDGDNLFTAVATDTIGNTGSANTSVFRADAPTISIDGFSDGDVTNSVVVAISGSVTGTELTVFVNDVIAPVDANGAFTLDVSLVEGPNQIVARVESPFGNASQAITLSLDTVAPLVGIVDPIDGSTTTLETIGVSGTASDPSGISAVVVNGIPAALNGTSWSAALPLIVGSNAIVATATDTAGNQASTTIQVIRELEPLTIDIGSPRDGVSTSAPSIVVSGFVSDPSASVSINGVSALVSGTSYSATIPLNPFTNIVTATAARGAETSEANIAVIRSTVDPPAPPPDPDTLAPPADSTVATNFTDGIAFLYEGPGAIQTVADPTVFQSKRLSVIRGRVSTRNGTGLAGVTVTVLGHPEFGSTVTRTDGGYDLAINGGGTYTVDLRYPGYIPAQRPVSVPWREFAIVEDVVLLALDPQANPIDLANPPSPIQIARGSVSSDADGIRQATVFFPAGTTATMRLADGSTQPLSQGTVRLTEFTVGDIGPLAMPGALPPTSGYTYAIDLCIDEAFAAGAVGVDFSQPVPLYVENFLGFPIGAAAPFGYYDYEAATWIPSDDGIVLRIASIDAGLATVEPSMALSDDERAALAATYPVGQELWRVPVPHFSEADINWPRGFPADADGAPFLGLNVPIGELAGKPACASGSVIECETQVLGESVPLVGTPFDLNYRSDRVPGRAAKRTIRIPVTTDAPPASLKGVEITIDVAGQRHEMSFPPTPSQPPASFTWDGKDAYGRDVNGSTTARVRIGWVYDAFYQAASAIGQSFSEPSDTQVVFRGSRLNGEALAVREFTTSLGAVDARGWGIGGWTLSSHHFYDPDAKILYRGDGSKRTTLGVNRIIDHFAGVGGGAAIQGIPGPAAAATFPIGDIAVGPDGTIYIPAGLASRMFRIDPDTGWIDDFSSPSIGAPAGVGLPIADTRLAFPSLAAVGADGSVFVVIGFGGNQIRKIGPDGIVSNHAGDGGPSGTCSEIGNGEGELATQVTFCSIRDLALGPDGSVYFTDLGTNTLGASTRRIRRVTPDGRVDTILGEGDSSADGIPAMHWTGTVGPMAVGPDGTVYFSDQFRVYRIRREDSIVETVGGGGNPADGIGDGLLATEARLFAVQKLLVDHEGAILVVSGAPPSNPFRVRRFVPGGTIRTIVGNGESGLGGNGQPATRAPLATEIRALAEGPDGTLFVGEAQNFFPLTVQIRSIRSAVADRSDASLTIPSEDGLLLFDFDPNGRHLRTRNALTDADLLTFGYDLEGRLIEIREIAPSGDPADDRVTTVTRDVDGLPIRITGPDGAVTDLTTDVNGYLETVSNPLGETHAFAYSADGLLQSYVRPAGGQFQFSYDALGLLIRDDDPEGGFQTLSRAEDATGYTVTLTSASGLARDKRVEEAPVAADGLQRRTRVDPAGFVTNILEIPGESSTIEAPSGLVTQIVLDPDPRLGLASPYTQQRTLTLPSGLVRSETATRVVTLDPVTKALLSQTDTVLLNGRPTVSVFDNLALTRQTTTPEGRVITQRLDAQGRTLGIQVGNLEEVRFEYDASGRRIAVRQGQGVDERVTTIARDANGNISSVSSLLGGSPLTTQFTYDGANRLISTISPGLSVIDFAYDANGNLVRLRPDGRPDHLSVYNFLDLEEQYEPPPVSAADPSSFTTYDLDRRPTLETRPDGSSIAFDYDLVGRLVSLTTPRGPTTFSYSATTGQLEGVVGPGGESLSYTFDGPLLSSVSWSGTISGSIAFQYDSDFRVMTESVNGAPGIGFVYDDDSLLVGAGALGITRDPSNGLVESTTLGSVATVHQYDPFGSLESMTASAGTTPLYSTSYQRDTLGRITQQSEVVQGTSLDRTYDYDLAGRLVGVTENGVPVRTYTYDGNGNRLSRADSSGTTAGVYDDQDRLL